MRTALLLSLAALALLAPNALAFHGSAYNAHGTAILGQNVYRADVSWLGWWSSTYTVKLTDVATGAVAVNTAFPGYEGLVYGGPIGSTWEIFGYNGYDSATGGQVFHIQGLQQIVYTPTLQTMAYVGHYQGYQLVLYVDGNLPA